MFCGRNSDLISASELIRFQLLKICFLEDSLIQLKPLVSSAAAETVIKRLKGPGCKDAVFDTFESGDC